MSDMVYLYGFVPPGTPEPPESVTGIAEASVRLLDLGATRAVVSDVPAAQFAPAVVESRLQDLAWVGEQGMAHERVVIWFADHADILPARMLSLYTGDAALREAAAGRMADVTAALRSLAGRREWNLKVAYDAEELARHGAEIVPEVGRLDEEMAQAAPGRRYLLKRRRTDVLKQEVSRAARVLADELLEALTAHAEDVQVLPSTEGDDAGTVVLNAALLVARDAEDGLRAVAAQLYQKYTALGMIVSFSGPWAPYRFVELYGDA
ncbi:MAG TPA: GvpL/GvpF family gas vesicle protein [Longimicrobiales bacterium]|nr:GvpL/GvpF family gas vesicle protein [Longimicrobiales bacterium]